MSKLKEILLKTAMMCSLTIVPQSAIAGDIFTRSGCHDSRINMAIRLVTPQNLTYESAQRREYMLPIGEDTDQAVFVDNRPFISRTGYIGDEDFILDGDKYKIGHHKEYNICQRGSNQPLPFIFER